MSGTLLRSPVTPSPPTSGPSDTLQRIERNTSDLLFWVKILVVVMVITVILDALVIV